jgi:glutamate-1-semialdehyde 2,1-aminomutase
VIDKIRQRLLLSKAKHPSLRGHAKMALRMSKLVPFYEYDDDEVLAVDGAAADVVAKRTAGLARLTTRLARGAPRTLAESRALESQISDVAFVNANRVPFQFRSFVQRRFAVGCLVAEAAGAQLRDLDGNWSYDLGGAYGVNVFGHDFYRRAMAKGFERAQSLGMTLGSYHPVITDNVARLRAISGLDEVSFHMSGTEAVMQAVRLARYHTGRSHVVRFCGAYHGWWDGVQAGVGNPRPAHEVYTLKEMDEATLEVLRTRDDIACVLVNPIQAMHPNGAPATDAMLVATDRTARYDKEAYRRWLAALRAVCTRRRIVLIIDDVFLGFRLARGGTQEYFGVRADLVTYGKTLGGGLPVGVVCGRRDLMRRFRDDRPVDICFARGTFNSHPAVMTAMNELLRFLDGPKARASYADLDQRWDARARALNERLERGSLPLRVVNMASVWTVLYTEPSRYAWMLQFYLRASGLAPSWIGTGRFIFAHDLSDADFTVICDRFVAAAEAMRDDGFFWRPPGMTNATIKQTVAREIVFAAARSALRGLFGGSEPAVPRGATPPAATAGRTEPAPVRSLRPEHDART